MQQEFFVANPLNYLSLKIGRNSLGDHSPNSLSVTA